MYRNSFQRYLMFLELTVIFLLIIVQTSTESESATSATLSSSLSLPAVIRHPGTCTFQRSQPACTFSLLCYLAGGVPVEGCGGDLTTTCCMLYKSHHTNSQYSVNPITSSPHSSHSNLQPSTHSYLESTLQNNYANHDNYNPPNPQHYSFSTYSSNEHTHNTIRRTRPVSNIKSPFKEISGRHISARSFVGEDFCGKPTAKPTNRIIGGQSAYFGEFPWQVHIKITKHQCGGALINQYYIVTAAHCIYQAPLSQLNVIIGAYDIEDQRYQDIPPQYFGVSEVKLHPSFRFSASHPDRFDIALLKLDRAVHYSSNVLPVCLPQNGFQFEGWHGLVTGWGKTDPALSNRYGTRLLQKVDVPIINNDECETWHRTRGIDLTIFSEMMCAGYEDGHKDACVGDSGGPLVVNVNGRWTLAGITSAGFGCAQSRQPGIYHRVSHSVDWILSNIN